MRLSIKKNKNLRANQKYALKIKIKTLMKKITAFCQSAEALSYKYRQK